MVFTPKNKTKGDSQELVALRFACAQHLDKHRRTLVMEWAKQLRAKLNIPTASNLPDPAYTALTYRALDTLFRKFLAAIRDNRLVEVIPDFVANHHEVLDHTRSLVPLLVKLEALSMLVRRSLIADPTIPNTAALYFFDRIFSTLEVEVIRTFGERRRSALKRLVDHYKQESQATQSVLGSCPVGILVTDKEGYITHFNAVQETIAKKPAAAVLGKRLYFDYAHRDSEEFREAFKRAVTLGETARFSRRRYESSTGVQYLDVTLAPVRDEHGEITGAVQMLEDVTAHVDMEERLRKQNRTLTTRLAELEEAYTYIGRINRQFASLVDINATLSSKLSLDKLLDFIVRSAAMLTRARLTTLRLIEGKQLVLAAQYGYTEQEEARYKQVPYGSGALTHVLSQDRVVTTNLVKDNVLFWPHLRDQLKLRQRLSAPLRSRGRTIGVLSIHLQEARELTQHEQNFLMALANHAALAIDLEKALSTVRSERHTKSRERLLRPTRPQPTSFSPGEHSVKQTAAPVSRPGASTLESLHADPIRYSR